MIDVSIDLETLGTKPGCVILSIAAIADYLPPGRADQNEWASGGVQEPTFHERINISDSVMNGFTVDPTTQGWWNAQPIEKRCDVMNGQAPVREVLHRFANWISALRKIGPNANVGSEITLWGYGVTFDISILGDAYDKCGIVKPWTYREEACLRTLNTFYKAAAVRMPAKEAHDALSDARAQLELLRQLKALRDN